MERVRLRLPIRDRTARRKTTTITPRRTVRRYLGDVFGRQIAEKVCSCWRLLTTSAALRSASVRKRLPGRCFPRPRIDGAMMSRMGAASPCRQALARRTTPQPPRAVQHRKLLLAGAQEQVGRRAHVRSPARASTATTASHARRPRVMSWAARLHEPRFAGEPKNMKIATRISSGLPNRPRKPRPIAIAWPTSCWSPCVAQAHGQQRAQDAAAVHWGKGRNEKLNRTSAMLAAKVGSKSGSTAPAILAPRRSSTRKHQDRRDNDGIHGRAAMAIAISCAGFSGYVFERRPRRRLAAA